MKYKGFIFKKTGRSYSYSNRKYLCWYEIYDSNGKKQEENGFGIKDCKRIVDMLEDE